MPESVCLTDDLKPIAPGGRIEVDYVGAKRFAGAEGKNAAIEAPDHLRQLDAGGLQMALHANVHLERRRETRRIHNGGTKLCCGRALRCQAGMTRPIAVAALAIDALGH